MLELVIVHKGPKPLKAGLFYSKAHRSISHSCGLSAGYDTMRTVTYDRVWTGEIQMATSLNRLTPVVRAEVSAGMIHLRWHKYFDMVFLSETKEGRYAINVVKREV